MSWSAQNTACRVSFLDCPIDSLTTDEAIEQIVGWCCDRRRPHIVCTVNAAILMMMRREEQLRRACCRSDMVLADGVPVVWAARLVGTPLVERVAGVDLMAHLLEVAARHKFSVFFLGAQKKVVTDLVGIYKRKYPSLIVAGYRDGYFSPERSADVINEIRACRPDMLFVGMPTPFKEVWCDAHKHELDVPLIMGVGGAFDVLANVIKRAPPWVQRIGMEWFWRLAMEPRKMWKRYLIENTLFICAVVTALFRKRLRTRPTVN